MIEAFFRTGKTRKHRPRSEDYSRTTDGKWYGDCVRCHKTFIYQDMVFVNPFDHRVGGFCYRCEREYCDIHIRWEKSTINNPQTGKPYDGFNAICPTCNILLNSHNPQLKHVDELMQTDPVEGMKVLRRVIDLLRERNGDKKEIQRLEELQRQLEEQIKFQNQKPTNNSTLPTDSESQGSALTEEMRRISPQLSSKIMTGMSALRSNRPLSALLSFSAARDMLEKSNQTEAFPAIYEMLNQIVEGTLGE